MHLVGFIIRIYHDVRSPERQSPVSPLHNDIDNRLMHIQTKYKEMWPNARGWCFLLAKSRVQMSVTRPVIIGLVTVI